MVWFVPERRSTEASPAQVVATGAVGGFGVDPIDGDTGWRALGAQGRQVPYWTLEKARAYSVAAYRSNPMAKAIIDTYTSFCVGDSGVSWHCPDVDVQAALDRFVNDPRNRLAALQEPLFRDHLVNGETALELMVGEMSGGVRFSYIDPQRISAVINEAGNPLWLGGFKVTQPGGDDRTLAAVTVDDITNLRTGAALLWRSWRALITDTRGYPFLATILDRLDDYDTVLSNLVDRTALARYMAFDVEVQSGGNDNAVDDFVKARGGRHVPPSGTIEVHNESVKWNALNVMSGSFEDTNTLSQLHIDVAAGAGLQKSWLADGGDVNRATALTMAEPVRRRVGGAQNLWLNEYQLELAQFAVDQQIARGRLPRMISLPDGREVPTAEAISVQGPAIAAADSQVTAAILVNLATALNVGIAGGLLGPDTARLAMRKGVEQFVGFDVPQDVIPDPAAPDKANPDNTAEAIEAAHRAGTAQLRVI